MLKQKTKDIEVEGVQYRLNKLDARSGSYVAMKIALLAAPVIGKGKMTEDAIASLVSTIGRKEFDELQGLLLGRVHKLTEVNGNMVPAPIVDGKGNFVDEELAYDVGSVINLTVQSIMFNVGDFFSAAGLMKNLAQ